MQRMTKGERLQLMRFVCSFAWADLEIQPEEREFVAQMIRCLELAPDEAKQVEQWLKVPPRAEEVDPTQVPRKHREIFLEAVRGVVMADGVLAPEEEENLMLFEALIR